MERMKFLRGASDLNPDRCRIIQAEHSHQVLAVDVLTVISHIYIKGLNHCQGHKILNLPQGTQDNMKFSHIDSSNSLYKFRFIRYNKTDFSESMTYYSRKFSVFNRRT